MSARRNRRAAERRGRIAETWTALWLMAKGYRIIGLRQRTPYGEIDIAALRSGALVIVEVKARPTLDEGLYAVGPTQQSRIGRAALSLAGRLGLTKLPIRFDVVVIGASLWPKHLRGAWEWRESAAMLR